MAKRKNRRGSSKAGRPRQEGERYACGKLKPPKPNERVMEARASLLGVSVGEGGKVADYQNASSPLDLAFTRGWLNERQHRAGVAYAAARAMAGMGSVRTGSGGIIENDPSLNLGKLTFREMTNAEVTAVFDSVFNRTGSEQSESRQAEALRRWKAMNANLSPAEQQQAHLVCVMQSWPQWVVQRVGGRFDTHWERSRDLLVSALNKIEAALRPPKKATLSQNEGQTDIAYSATPAPKRLVEQRVEVNEQGEVVRVVERYATMRTD